MRKFIVINRCHNTLDNFQTAPKPPVPPLCDAKPPRKLPPWNGYGSFEDSAQNCLKVS